MFRHFPDTALKAAVLIAVPFTLVSVACPSSRPFHVTMAFMTGIRGIVLRAD